MAATFSFFSLIRCGPNTQESFHGSYLKVVEFMVERVFCAHVELGLL